MPIGMAVEGGQGNFGADDLAAQVEGETEEQRKKRLQQQTAAARLYGPAAASIGIGTQGIAAGRYGAAAATLGLGLGGIPR